MADRIALARLLPGSLEDGAAIGQASANWQQRKSLATRNAVLDAALACLSEAGYAGCSLQVVADRAGISRGAMLHHYASKLDLMEAVVEYAFYRRMAEFLARIRALTEAERAERNAGVEISYESCLTPEYRAYLELHLASRTDPELRDCFLDRARRYDRVWRDEVEKVFPEWVGDPRLDLMTDFVWSMVEGYALNADIWNDAARGHALLRFAADTLRAVRAGQLSPLMANGHAPDKGESLPQSRPVGHPGAATAQHVNKTG
jgi:AcrR family transcriptional regulator